MACEAANLPQRLVALEAEIGTAKVPIAERFRELLDVAVQIAHINSEAQASA
jgi:hypothetical protein